MPLRITEHQHESHGMATRSARLEEFVTQVAPAPGTLVELLCEDHVGTYLLRYPCRSTADGFRNERTGEAILGHVVGWRELSTREPHPVAAVSAPLRYHQTAP